ncbi:AAA family ATPase [Limosilactobacillus mucosae]|uniref:AAA family ATPase n=1 Tax=Limosilactobacillus mucosae TaxID=97478 RepID=UPI0039957AE8
MINPFNPGFGNISPCCIKRPALQQKLLDQASQLNQKFLPVFIDGPRGCGKTVFLNNLGDAMLERDDWITVDLGLDDDFFSTLVGAIYYQADTMTSEELDVLDYDTPSAMFVQYVKTLTKHQLRLFITVDEANRPTEELLELLKLCQQLGNHGNTIMVVLAGITSRMPQFLGDENFAAVVQESQRLTLPLLDLDMVASQYQQIFTKAHRVIEPAVLKKMAMATGGYAYAFQILGSLLWDTDIKRIDQAAFEKIMPSYQQQLFNDAYLPIINELTMGDREVIEILAHEMDNVVDEKFLKEQINDTSSAAPICLQHLVENQIIHHPQPGKVAFALPYFREFAIKNEALIA